MEVEVVLGEWGSEAGKGEEEEDSDDDGGRGRGGSGLTWLGGLHGRERRITKDGRYNGGDMCGALCSIFVLLLSLIEWSDRGGVYICIDNCCSL